jgi:hypothetical protein
MAATGTIYESIKSFIGISAWGFILLRVLPVILSGLEVEFVVHKAAWSQE